MKVYVMLTVDLNRYVSEDARKRFYEYLAKEQWTKLSLTTTWCAAFKDGVTTVEAITTTKTDVKNAAAHAGVGNYEAAAEPGYEAPTVWDQAT
jgi:hypothetical protein